MEITPLVSICSITYNHAPYIRQCLDGFLMQQTTFPIEIIINDDCSTDGTTEIVKEYAEKYPDLIRPIFHEENQYQKGVKGMFATFVFPKARGKYIAMCEGDDYWTDPLKLQKQVDFLEANPEYGLVHTRAKVFTRKKEEFSKDGHTIGSPFKNFDELLVSNKIATLTTCFRNDLCRLYLDEVHLYPKWRMGDYPLWLFIASKSSVYFMQDITSVYRELENSASHFTDLKNECDFILDSFDVSRFFCVRHKKYYLLSEIGKKIFYRLLYALIVYDCSPDKYIWNVMWNLKLLTFKRLLLLLLVSSHLGRSFLRNRWHLNEIQ